MSGRGKKKKKRNGLTSWSPYRKTVHQEFRQEFLQARYVLLRLRDHCFLLWSHLPVYELLKFNSRKGNYSTSTLLLGVEFQKGVWIFLLSFSFFFSCSACFSGWSDCPSSSPCSSHTPFWLATTDLSSYITYCWEDKSYVPAVCSSVSSRCWKSNASQYFMHLKSNTVGHIWLLQGALYISLLSLSRCAKLLLPIYH